ncbi:hypothetical protein GYMLUDRAFT_242375 [Collybiopsis luxurians FD-317 M1]|uniref:Uncharacterized protein n=1 Tax=Collybiopsis luxurians FD-317 M1 TaxID=944289 RepID=A0A0D0BFP5_9AGAR|nr:hypothetical protein GYMLUDRAFT_242375 [Collybiopsis luxurians FD-317 M1]
MSLRAHILRNDFSIDLSRPVPAETLDALGWKTASLSGSPDPEQSARKLAQDWGISLTEDSVTLFDLKKNADNPPKIAEVLVQMLQFSGTTTFAFTMDAAAFLKSGNINFDVEDVASKSWIHLELGPTQMYRIPAGAKLRITFSDQKTNMAGLGFINGGLSNLGVIEEKDLDKCTIRMAYLRSIGKDYYNKS